jgi:hypothetical protein
VKKIELRKRAIVMKRIEELRIDARKHFNIMVSTLQEEDKNLKEIFGRFTHDADDYFGRGIFWLEEKHLQYLLFRSLLKFGDLQAYIEELYDKSKMKCDLMLYDSVGETSIWIEIKSAGFWENIPNTTAYWKWINADVKKLSRL